MILKHWPLKRPFGFKVNMSKQEKLLTAFSDVITRQIYTLARTHCNGCKISHPSQREHTCLGIDYYLNPVDNVELYFDEAYANKNLILNEIHSCLPDTVDALEYFYNHKRIQIKDRVKVLCK